MKCTGEKQKGAEKKEIQTALTNSEVKIREKRIVENGVKNNKRK